jgi:hypothetical protein
LCSGLGVLVAKQLFAGVLEETDDAHEQTPD